MWMWMGDGMRWGRGMVEMRGVVVIFTFTRFTTTTTVAEPTPLFLAQDVPCDLTDRRILCTGASKVHNDQLVSFPSCLRAVDHFA